MGDVPINSIIHCQILIGTEEQIKSPDFLINIFIFYLYDYTLYYYG